jgi:hypothetical protein
MSAPRLEPPKETMRRVLAILALSLTAVGVGALAPATSSAKVAVGLGEQKIVFQNPAFKSLKTKRVRYIAPWNVAKKKKDRTYFDAWYKSARKAHQEVLVSFNIASGCRRPKRGKCGLPSVKSYTSAFKAFRKRYKRIKIISPWNEANHVSQPTFRKPKRAAQFYNVVRKRCKGCKIVAADVIDETNMVRWLTTFKKTAKKPRIWGLHNYRDTNPRKKKGKSTAGGTKRLLRAVRGEVWMTETGGLYYFKLGGKYVFKPSAKRQNKGVKRMFSLAKRYRKRIKRLYIYQFQAPFGKSQFDAGLVAGNGTTKRSSYNTVVKTLKTQKRYFKR